MRFDRIPSVDGLLRALDDEPGARLDTNERRVDAIIMGVTAPALALESVRPRLRGRLHQAAAIVSVGGLAWMIVDARSSTALVSAWVYGLATIALYATSSTYHVYARSDRARRVMQRLDHSMIYVLIAGSYTPVCLLALHGTFRWVLLAVVWVGAIVGVLITALALERFSRLHSALYLVLGWTAVLAVPELANRTDLVVLAAVGGLLYTGGAILFALQRPRPVAVWFGYHEFWHAIGVAAGGAIFAMNLGLIAAA